MNPEVNACIQRLKAMADGEGLSLDCDQTRNFFFLMYELLELKPLPPGVRYAVLDLLGTLDAEGEGRAG